MSIKIDLKIFLFIFLFFVTSQIEIYILLMVFAIIHEIGHLIAGIILKFKPKEIKLTPFGLQISFYITLQNDNKEFTIKKAIIALAGPITNLAIATVTAIMVWLNPNITNLYIYQIIVYSNLIIGLFNLIPIYPMDGGRIIKEILKLKYGNKKSYKYTYIISKVALIILTVIVSIAILFIHNIALILILAYLWHLCCKGHT